MTGLIEITEINCSSWEEYCVRVRPGDGSPMDPIFRGHADCIWDLVPPSARYKLDQFRKMRAAGIDVQSGAPAPPGQLRYFKRLATGLPNFSIDGLSDIDVEALARHNGLSTNLLDWTSSPYIAAFFAFTTALDRANDGRLLSGTLDQSAILYPTSPVCIWRLSCTKDIWIENEFELLSSLTAVNYWQKAQWGLFTRLLHKEHLDIASYLDSRGLLSRLMRFVIPGSETGKALCDLEAMNITFATLFPDVRGAALQANVGSTWKFLGAF